MPTAADRDIELYRVLGRIEQKLDDQGAALTSLQAALPDLQQARTRTEQRLDTLEDHGDVHATRWWNVVTVTLSCMLSAGIGQFMAHPPR